MRVMFTAGPDDHDRRLETVLRRMCPHQSLGSLHKALRKGDIRLNGAKVPPETRVSSGDTLTVWDALLPPRGAVESAEPIPEEWVVYQGSDLVAVNKPSGVLVHRGEHPGPGESGLDDRVRAWLNLPRDASLGFRPGPLHRLDKETSGLVVFSRTLAGARTFSKALAGRQIEKTYLAVLRGRLPGPREVRNALTRDQAARTTFVDEEGGDSVSVFRPLAYSEALTLAEVGLGTGRTHQIRVHAQSLGFPLAGDGKYAGGPTPAGLDVPFLLHAWRLRCSLLPPLTAPLPGPRAAWVEKTFKISLPPADPVY